MQCSKKIERSFTDITKLIIRRYYHMKAKKKRLTSKTKKSVNLQSKTGSKTSKKTKTVVLRRNTDFPWGNITFSIKPKVSKNTKIYYRRRSDIDSCKDLNDSELVEVIQNQNREIYKELFRRYQRKLFVYIFHLVGNKDETEDILQNVFVKTYKNIENFDKEKKFSSWIYRIAHNEAVNFLKRKNKKFFVSWEDVSASKDKLEMNSSNEIPEDIWMQQEVTQEIGNAMEKLPDKYKQILMYRYFSEYSYDKIGQILDKPVNTVGTLINRAKKKLYEVVKEENIGK